MHTYPLFLDLGDACCLVVGAGNVARRKLAGLLEAGTARVLVVAPAIACDSIRVLLEHPSVSFQERPFEDRDVEDCRLVFAASGNRDVNAAVAKVCRERGILCSVADVPSDGSCISPAIVDCGRLRLALSSGGIAPALTQRIKKELNAWLQGRYERQITLLARIRPLITSRDDLSQPERAALLHALAGPECEACLASGDAARCAGFLRDRLPTDLHHHIAEIVHELV